MKRAPLLCLLTLLLTQQAFPWGHAGHAVVADIAESRLTPEAARQVHEILAVEHFEHLHDVSAWADEIKKDRLPGSPAHSQRQPLDHSTEIVIGACPSHYCAVQGIHDYYKMVADKSAPLEKREIALKYLVHLVGDIHQPFHGAAITGGGIHVVFLGKNDKLHGVWDAAILYTRGRDPKEFAKKFEAEAADRKLAYGGTPEQWALESRDLVRDRILPELPKAEDGKPIALPDNYGDKNWDVVQDRITQAGYRLAELLNSALK